MHHQQHPHQDVADRLDDEEQRAEDDEISDQARGDRRGAEVFLDQVRCTTSSIRIRMLPTASMTKNSAPKMMRYPIRLAATGEVPKFFWTRLDAPPAASASGCCRPPR